MYFQPLSDRDIRKHELKYERYLLRQAILDFLVHSSYAHSPREIFAAVCDDKEAGRKMLRRMKRAGELVSPARGLYTLPGHLSMLQATNKRFHVPNPARRTT